MASTKEELFAAWLAGELDAEGAKELLVLLRAQPELLDEAVRLKCFDRLLRVAVHDAGADAFEREVASRCGVTATEPNLTPHIHLQLRWKRWVALAAAACIVIACGLAMWNHFRPVATVVRLESAEWKGNRKTIRTGARLARGHFFLLSGFASLHFKHGADLLLEGPAEFDLLSPDLVRLRSGNAFAHVPKPAIGFTIESPSGRAVDRGTDFGVHVGDKDMEVHTFKGLVRAGNGSNLQSVHANEAVQMSAGAVNSITADEGRFLTALPPTGPKEIGWAHWAFDEGQGNTTKTDGAGLPGISAPARLLSLDASQSAGPQWTTGQFGSALSFDGTGAYVQTDFPGIGDSGARTIALWVKAPRDLQPKNGYALVSWGNTDAQGDAWQISLNPKADRGPLGVVRVGRIGEPILGSTDLRDDHWHHLAVIFYGMEKRDHQTEVLIYVDGELEHTLRKGVPIVHTDVSSEKAKKVSFGLNIGPYNTYDRTKPAHWLVFRGCLDEVFICDAALNRDQVRELMTRNRVGAFVPTKGH